MKQNKLAIGSIALALLTGACMDTEEDIETEETEEVEQGLYTAWYNLSGPAGSGVVRACKTATRINWEFGYNSYTTAMTGGNGMSTITSNIAGQSWGQKYRTRGSATTFQISLGTNGSFKGVVYQVAQLPNC